MFVVPTKYPASLCGNVNVLYCMVLLQTLEFMHWTDFSGTRYCTASTVVVGNYPTISFFVFFLSWNVETICVHAIRAINYGDEPKIGVKKPKNYKTQNKFGILQCKNPKNANPKWNKKKREKPIILPPKNEFFWGGAMRFLGYFVSCDATIRSVAGIKISRTNVQLNSSLWPKNCYQCYKPLIMVIKKMLIGYLFRTF